MATTITILHPYETGADLKYPVVIKGPPNIADYIIQGEIKDDSELAIGDLALIDTNQLLDTPTDAMVYKPVIILDTTHNKAVLESHAVTVSKAATFFDGDKVDVLLLVPGLILSVKISYAGTDEADILYGDHVKCGHTPTQVEKATVTLTDIGVMLCDCVVGNTLKYGPMLVI
jgi:hypothetical protein